MFRLINEKLSRQVVVGLLIILLPVLAITTVAVVYNETTRVEQETIAVATIAAKSGAKAYAAILEIGIAEGKFTLQDLIHADYQEITETSSTGDLRFHTKYDFWTDKYLQGVEDEILHSSPGFLYTTGIDVTGYVPTTHSEYSQAPSTDKEWNKVYSRSKKRYDKALHRAAARTTVTLVQPYTRDTGEDCWDVAVPITVQNAHYGAFRVGVTRAYINDSEQEVIKQLVIIFLILTIVVSICMYLLIRVNMQPLEDLILLIEAISKGENLTAPISSKKKNEVGRVAKSVNRLRNSLLAAMARMK